MMTAFAREDRMRHAVLLVVVALFAGCATSASRTTRNRNLITWEEVSALQVATAYEVVQILRPAFLRTRGAASISDPTPVPAVVYLDGFRHGNTPDALKTIDRISVREIEYLDSRQATTRFGTGHRGGAILVRTR
jgi:hypothetical protein